jgi:hypothetical protein
LVNAPVPDGPLFSTPVKVESNPFVSIVLAPVPAAKTTARFDVTGAIIWSVPPALMVSSPFTYDVSDAPEPDPPDPVMVDVGG